MSPRRSKRIVPPSGETSTDIQVPSSVTNSTFRASLGTALTSSFGVLSFSPASGEAGASALVGLTWRESAAGPLPREREKARRRKTPRRTKEPGRPDRAGRRERIIDGTSSRELRRESIPGSEGRDDSTAGGGKARGAS